MKMTSQDIINYIEQDLKVYSLVSSSIYPSEAYTRVFARREDALKAFAEERQYALDRHPEATIHDDHPNVFYLDDEGSDVLLHLEIHESTIQ
jgi:hypothetical protein